MKRYIQDFGITPSAFLDYNELVNILEYCGFIRGKLGSNDMHFIDVAVH